MALGESDVIEKVGSYDEAADIRFHRDEVDRMYETLRASGVEVSPDSIVLDVGGGSGTHSGFLASIYRRVICMDFSDQNARFDGRLVGLLREKFCRNGFEIHPARIEFHQGDAMDLMYRDNLFDFIVSFNAFEHIPDPSRALAEMFRVLRPGGVIYLTFDPIWTCDSGSHFQHRVPEPWQHLVSTDADFMARLKQGGGSDDEAQEFTVAMNRRPLAYYRDLFDAYRGRVDYLAEYEWSGCVDPSHQQHANFNHCLKLGYSSEELMFRGMAKVMRKTG